MDLGRPYRPRSIRFLGQRAQDGWRVELYGVAANGDLARQELVDATVSALAPNLPENDEQTYGVGFAIAHDADDYCFALIHWFANENEIHQRMLSAPGNSPPHSPQIQVRRSAASGSSR